MSEMGDFSTIGFDCAPMLRGLLFWPSARLLKNSLSTQNSSKLGDAKCLGIRKRRLNGIVMQSYFRQFLKKSFSTATGYFVNYETFMHVTMAASFHLPSIFSRKSKRQLPQSPPHELVRSPHKSSLHSALLRIE
jgi:hypothetical protein